MYEIVTDWTTPAGGGSASVMYFEGTATVADARTALHAFFTGCRPQLGAATSWRIRTDGRVLNEQTGGLTGVWNDATVRTDTGTGSGTSVADATQALVRWQTGQIVNGRFLRGRTFIPGIVATALQAGNLTSTAIGQFTLAGSNLINAAVGMGVWHRPTNGAGGAFHLATQCSVWDELAVLRRRRK